MQFSTSGRRSGRTKILKVFGEGSGEAEQKGPPQNLFCSSTLSLPSSLSPCEGILPRRFRNPCSIRGLFPAGNPMKSGRPDNKASTGGMNPSASTFPDRFAASEISSHRSCLPHPQRELTVRLLFVLSYCLPCRIFRFYQIRTRVPKSLPIYLLPPQATHSSGCNILVLLYASSRALRLRSRARP